MGSEMCIRDRYRATLSITQDAANPYSYNITCTGMACNGKDMGLAEADLKAVIDNVNITFNDADGSLATGNPLTLKVTGLGAAFNKDIEVDVSQITCFGKDTSLKPKKGNAEGHYACLLYTSDAADEEDSVDLGGRRIIKKKKKDDTREQWVDVD